MTAGPTPLQLLRALPRIRRDPVGFLTDAVAAHGDLVPLPIPGQPVLLVNDPDGARRVLQDNPGGYTKATIQYRSLTTVTGIGLLTADGEEWRRRRRVVHAGSGDRPRSQRVQNRDGLCQGAFSRFGVHQALALPLSRLHRRADGSISQRTGDR